MKRMILAVLCAFLSLSLVTACTTAPGGEGEDTPKNETQVLDLGDAVRFDDGLSIDAYPEDSPAGDFIAGCTAIDRDEQFEAFALYHSATEGDMTTHTYLVYYRHGAEEGMSATPALLALSSGTCIQLTYTPGGDTAAYSLCRLSVTLSADDSPYLRLVADDDTVGSIITVTDSEIPLP